MVSAHRACGSAAALLSLRRLIERAATDRRSVGVGFCFLDEHDGDSIHDRIEHLAGRAPEAVGLFELHLRVALWTRKDLEQLGGDHLRMVVRLRT
jgi:hypothetical protein